MKRLLALDLAAPALAVIAAGCGGSSQPGAAAGGSAYGGSKPASAQAAATVATARTKLGTVLVDAHGRTLYLFEKDKGTASTCYGACAGVWPPLATGSTVMAGTGVAAAKLGSAKRSDGKTAVTYGGHPLYTYAGDSKPGAVQGQGLDQFGAQWYVVAPSGRKIANG
jgi:predicted lipoprotein with Yx(FWY)xxD motif